jgi:REP-associated tyrosine transposase
MGRGNNKMPIYLDDLDRLTFIRMLKRALDEYEVELWSACQMGNHYHLVLCTRLPNISAAMRQLNGVYAQWWNRRHERVGHVFQGRFKAQIIEDGTYLVRVCRYVLMNPVRGRLCQAPGDWPWSTYAALAGLPSKPWHVDLESLLRRVGDGDFDELRKALVIHVSGEDAEMGEWIRGDRRVIGSDTFAQRFRVRAASASKEIPLRERRIGAPSLMQLLTSSLERGAGLHEGIVLAHRDYSYSVEDIARCSGISSSTIARLLRKNVPGAAVTAEGWG